MEIRPNQPTTKGPAEWFTGDVWIDSIVPAGDASPLAVIAVRFSPGARTAWHAHSRGQTLYVTDGHGLVQSRGKEVAPVHAGVIVHTPAGEWHWHGAAPDRYMSHLSITEGPAEWGDHVSDDHYASAAKASSPDDSDCGVGIP